MTSKEYTKRLADLEGALDRVFPGSVTLDWARAVAGQEELPLNPATLDRINAPGWELLSRGGKRWRPLVMVLSHDLYGGNLPQIDDLSALVELPHNGSLIVDDIEDKADQRRGGPAIHLVHGVDMAINTGNFLYYEPTFLIDRLPLPETDKYRITKYYLRVMRRLHFGQGLDIVWHNDHDYLPDRAEYLQMCRFKTGALARLAAEVGAVAARAEDPRVEAIGSLWEDIGVGFQILDDVKNLITGNPGKIRGDDIVEGKKSLPVLLHGALANDRGRSLLDLFQRVSAAHQAGSPSQGLIDEAIALMEASGALGAAAEEGGALLGGAVARLRRDWPASTARDGMEDLVDTFWEGLK
ncbi:MAG TPA: polyprenyl synthetase family protein [Spirochaetia bacterium]|jgi:octaprenyl-diphosphate synthase|nr:polyprenyl synthetase family protein [Spirochaetia bacterium]